MALSIGAEDGGGVRTLIEEALDLAEFMGAFAGSCDRLTLHVGDGVLLVDEWTGDVV